MATCKDFDSGSDQITQICSYCSNVSDGYCHDCEMFMCQTCFDTHTKARPCRHHVLADNSSKPDIKDKCSKTCVRHPNLHIQYYCVDHELVGCIQCFFPDHRNCRFEEIQKAAEQFYQRGDDSRLKDKLHELESKHIEYRSQCNEDKESVEDMDTKVVKDVKSFKKDVIAFAKKVEAHALEEAERLRIDNETLVEKRMSELDNVGENIEQCLVKLEKQPTADEFFIAAIEVKPEVEKLEKKLTSIEGLGAVKRYIFTPRSEVMEMIQDVRSFGEIRTISDQIPDVATCVINKKNQKDESTMADTLIEKQQLKQLIEDKEKKEKERTIDGVSAIVWKITRLVCKKTIDRMERKGCKIRYDAEQQKVFLPAIDKPDDAKLKDLRDTIEYMQKMEIHESLLTPEESGKCDNICREMGDRCCIFDQENNTFYIYSDTFDDLQKYKRQFEIRIGRKKSTAGGSKSKATVLCVSSKTQTTSPVSSPGVPTEPKYFKTLEGVKVMVYKANILSLDVDCIVNASNSDLNHGGGVARVIAKAAGDDFEQDCKGYIRRNKKLPVGQACSTTAGKLMYKCVIHTVGPQWWDYNKKPNGQEKCEDALRSAITSSIELANRNKMKSIAFPAISSAIFGVPLDICATQYVEAVKEYSRYKNEYDLCEVHFIDVREEIVRAMQDAFSNGLQ